MSFPLRFPPSPAALPALPRQQTSAFASPLLPRFPSPTFLLGLPRPRATVTSSSLPVSSAREKHEGEEGLPTGLRRESLPRHVAVIMDGNSRWARARGLPVSAGHEAGYRALREAVDRSAAWGIRVVTVFAFSAENWLRPKTEVDFLMRLFEGVLRDNVEDFTRQGIKLCIIGDSSKLPKSLQILAKDAEQLTRYNSRLELLVAVSYSGRGDVVQACQKIAVKVKDGILDPTDITESIIAAELQTSCTSDYPCPDLLIRTSGELRLSNFLLWQLAYTELYFTGALWPDFGESHYIEALLSFQQRKRRYGRRIPNTQIASSGFLKE